MFWYFHDLCFPFSIMGMRDFVCLLKVICSYDPITNLRARSHLELTKKKGKNEKHILVGKYYGIYRKYSFALIGGRS